MADKTTGRPRGFGFVTYADPAVAQQVAAGACVADAGPQRLPARGVLICAAFPRAETHLIDGRQVRRSCDARVRALARRQLASLGRAAFLERPADAAAQVDVKVAVPKELAVPRAAAAAPPLAAAPRSCKARWRARVVPLCSCTPSVASPCARSPPKRLASRAPRQCHPHASPAAQIFVGGLAPTTTEGARPPQLQRHLQATLRRCCAPSHRARAARPRRGSCRCGVHARRFWCHAPRGAPRRFAGAVPPSEGPPKAQRTAQRSCAASLLRANPAPRLRCSRTAPRAAPLTRLAHPLDPQQTCSERPLHPLAPSPTPSSWWSPPAAARAALASSPSPAKRLWTGALASCRLIWRRNARIKPHLPWNRHSDAGGPSRAAACSPRAPCRSWRASAWRSSALCLERSCLRRRREARHRRQPRPQQQPRRAAPAPHVEQRPPRRSRTHSQR